MRWPAGYEAMGKISVLHDADHVEIRWDPLLPEEVAFARSMFEQYLREGYVASRIGEDPSKAVQITEFDPSAEEIILLSILEGG